MDINRINCEDKHNNAERQSLMNKSLSDSLFCAVDVETSGLSASSRIVEIGAVLFRLNGRVSTFQSLINPHQSISQSASKIHGISNEMVKNAPSASEILPLLMDFMDGSVLIAHNASFDVKMLSSEMERTNLPRPSQPVICTVKLAKSVFAGLENFRLTTLVKHLKIDCERLHRGLDDALAAMEVFLKAASNFCPKTKVKELPGFEGIFTQICSPPQEKPRIKGIPEELPYLANMKIPIEIEYGSPNCPHPIIVTPVRVYNKNDRQYLCAYSHRDGIYKTYRVDRILFFRSA